MGILNPTFSTSKIFFIKKKNWPWCMKPYEMMRTKTRDRNICDQCLGSTNRLSKSLWTHPPAIHYRKDVDFTFYVYIFHFQENSNIISGLIRFLHNITPCFFFFECNVTPSWDINSQSQIDRHRIAWTSIKMLSVEIFVWFKTTN